MTSRAELELRISEVKSELNRLEAALLAVDDAVERESDWPLREAEYFRYGRQLILNEIGIKGQLLMKNGNLLIIGAGGLGSPVLLYLVAAGIGKITILDHDTVDLSNLHRQVIHTEARIGTSKAKSAELTLKAINSSIIINALDLPFTPSLFAANSSTPEFSNPKFNLILDCTDNPATRHLINAYSAAFQIPLVSGGAVRTEGVVGIYSLPLKTENEIGPCYACIFPPSPVSLPVEDPLEEELRQEKLALLGTGACSDEGVLGVLCGSVGMTMCSETIRVILGTAKPTLHLISPLSNNPFRTIKVRARKQDCPTCSSIDSTPLSRWKSNVEMLNSTGEWPDWVDPLCDLPPRDAGAGRITTTELKEMKEIRLIDARSKVEFEIAHLDGAINIPFSQILRDPAAAISSAEKVVVICKKGNDSFIAARALRRSLIDTENVEVLDVVGGLKAWSKNVDNKFPNY